MSSPDDAPVPPLLASGVLALRGRGRRRRVAVVERGGAWGLPRGLVPAGEGHLTVLRTVGLDQVGVALEPVDFLAARRAQLGERSIVTLYWMARPGRAVPGFRDGGRVQWLDLEAAAERVDYPEERALLEELRPGPGALARLQARLGLGRRGEARRRADHELARREARSALEHLDLIDREGQAGDGTEAGRWASALATARQASALDRPGARELVPALFHGAERRDLLAMDDEDRALRAALLAAELAEQDEPEGWILGQELRAGSQPQTLARVLDARADLAAAARGRAYAAGPPWRRLGLLAALVLSAPWVLRGHALDPDLTAIHLPWTGALWGGLLGSLLLPGRDALGRLTPSAPALAGAGGLALWLAVLAGLWSPSQGPPAVLFGCAVAGALATRLAAVTSAARG